MNKPITVPIKTDIPLHEMSLEEFKLYILQSLHQMLYILYNMSLSIAASIPAHTPAHIHSGRIVRSLGMSLKFFHRLIKRLNKNIS